MQSISVIFRGKQNTFNVRNAPSKL